MIEIIIVINVLALIFLFGAIIFIVRQKKFEKESLHEAQNILTTGMVFVLSIILLSILSLIPAAIGISAPFDIQKYVDLATNLFLLPLTAILFFVYILKT